jgi:hypothetical protein
VARVVALLWSSLFLSREGKARCSERKEQVTMLSIGRLKGKKWLTEDEDDPFKLNVVTKIYLFMTHP